MPEVPDTVDDAIEPLTSPSTDEVFEATRPFSAREIASAAASEALSGGGGGLLFSRTVITDAQIRTLLNVHPTLVEAPGPGKCVHLPLAALSVVFMTDFVEVYDALIPDDDGALQMSIAGEGSADTEWYDLFSVGRLFTSGYDIYWPGMNGMTGATNAPDMTTRAAIEDKPLVFRSNAANLTGGDPANTLTIDVLYSVLDLP